jgi:hypothetical protein
MTTIIIKNSSTSSAVPVSGDLTKGELAVNVTDKKLYTKDNGGSVVKLVGSLGNQEASAVAITGGAIDGTPIGATTASTASFTTLSASGNVTLSGGTANGVLYLNGSKVATSGSALTFDGTNFGIGLSASSPLEVQSNSGGTAIRIRGRATANTGTLRFYANDGTTQQAKVEVSDNTFEVGSITNVPFVFNQNGSEAMRLTSSSLYTASGINVGIGTSSPATRLHINGADGTSGLFIQKAGTAQSFFGAESTWLGTGTSNNTVVNAYGANSLMLATNGIERARIDSPGRFLLNQTSNNGTALMQMISPATTNAILVQIGTNGYNAMSFLNAGGLAAVGSITIDSSSTSYNTSSDYRLKNTITPMTGALAKVAQLKPVTYKWNADGSDGEGFIAHELAEVCPQAVTGAKDEVDAEGNPQYQGIDTSFLVATLTAAIQELKAEFDAYKASHP